MIDEALAWIEQIILITSKVNKGLNALKRSWTFVDLKILKLVYKTLIQLLTSLGMSWYHSLEETTEVLK